MAILLLISTFLPSSLALKVNASIAEHVVISQVYGGGGNSGAPFNRDFIELYNPTDSPVDLTGWSVQYASSKGNSWEVTPLTGTIESHGYYLVGQAFGSGNGVDIVTPDAEGASTMAGTNVKVALFDTTTPATDINPDGAIDFVGTGSANAYEGDSAAKVMYNKTSAQRRPYAKVDPAPNKGNAWDTNQNGDDFYVGEVVAPRNTASQIEAPMVPIISLDPNGDKIQFLKEGSTGNCKRCFRSGRTSIYN